MAKLTLVYHEEDEESSPLSGYVRLANIECDDMLEGLAILHERLNAVAMPRVYRNTSGGNPNEIADGLRANDQFPTTVSC